jgi:hypothetical protein
MQRRITNGSVVLLFLLAGIANANTDTKASALRDVCKNWAATAPDKPVTLPDSYHEAACKGYMMEWSSGMEGLTMPDEKGTDAVVRFEDGITPIQMAKVFVLYMSNHPEEENKAGHVALMHAMSDAQLFTLESLAKDQGK